MDAFLSIIVPVYKVEQYIYNCIDSILSQTFIDFELIIVDDGSPDNCPLICDEYAQKDKRIKVIHKQNGGLVSARKAGLETASGQYVGFVDSDDWIEPDMYECLCSAAKEYRSDIIICDIIFNYGDMEERPGQYIKPGLYDKDKLLKEVYPRMIYAGEFYKFGLYPAVWNKIFKRDLLKRNLSNVHNSIRMGEDAACTYPCLLEAQSLYILDHKYLYHYRQDVLSMSKNYDENFFERILLLYKLLKEILASNGLPDVSAQLYFYFTYLIIQAVNNEFDSCNKKDKRMKYEYVKNILFNYDVNESLCNISLNKIPLKSKIYIWLLKKKQITILFYLIMLLRKYRSIFRK